MYKGKKMRRIFPQKFSVWFLTIQQLIHGLLAFVAVRFKLAEFLSVLVGGGNVGEDCDLSVERVPLSDQSVLLGDVLCLDQHRAVLYIDNV